MFARLNIGSEAPEQARAIRANRAKGTSAPLARAGAISTAEKWGVHRVCHGGPRRGNKGSGTAAMVAVVTN